MKKFKLIVGAVALFALVVANVWNAATVAKATALNIEDLEALAQYEPSGEKTGMAYVYAGMAHDPFRVETSGAWQYRQSEAKYFITYYDCEPRTWGTAHCRPGTREEGLSIWNYLWENRQAVQSSTIHYYPDGERI
ncbi:MAG: hypothetical protein IKP73_00065 [Bacteroidales bacterium]|nr:hypothetical protein [Bacteroidales bacterium]MBR4323899.1 hypothetical protein [Bacteroidales bacterium]